MTRRVAAILAVLVVGAGCAPRSPSPRPLRRVAAGGIVGAKPVATGLDFPAAFAFAPNGLIYYGELTTGRIVVLDPRTGRRHGFFRVPNVASSGEQGLLGIALAPGFPATPYLYAYATRHVGGGLRNQILRITSAGGRGVSMKTIFTSSTTAGVYHDGGHIAFGPDGMLYAVVGEAHSSSNSQNLSVSGGKILRMTPSGGLPTGNPFGTRVYAYGIRNSFGFGFDPRTGQLWESENGPECDDELNRIVAGRNYGWGPHETCSTPPPHPRDTNQDGPSPMLPLLWYTPPIAPTGLAFCARCGLGAGSEGTLFFGAYNTGELRRVRLNSNRLAVASQAVVYRHGSGILSVQAAPDGHLFFSDSQGIYRLVIA